MGCPLRGISGFGPKSGLSTVTHPRNVKTLANKVDYIEETKKGADFALYTSNNENLHWVFLLFLKSPPYGASPYIASSLLILPHRTSSKSFVLLENSARGLNLHSRLSKTKSCNYQSTLFSRYLRPFRLLQQNTTYWVAYELQEFISHSSGGWEMKDQGASMVR